MSMSKILVTGAGGQVGHALGMASSPHQLVALSRNELDITRQDEVIGAVNKHRPDVVINAAAYTAVDKAEQEKEQAFAINRDAVKNLALACIKNNIPLLHISTDYVFNGEKTSAYTEKDSISPIGVYGQSKAEGEEALRNTLNRHIILRTSWVFSATGDNFVKTMLRLGKERDELSIVADQKGCPTSARSIAEVLLQIAELYLSGKEIPWGTYHYSNKPETTWFEFAKAIFEESAALNGSPVPKLNAINTNDYPTAAQRPLNSVLDCRKLEDTFGVESVFWRDELIQVLRRLNPSTSSRVG